MIDTFLLAEVNNYYNIDNNYNRGGVVKGANEDINYDNTGSGNDNSNSDIRGIIRIE